MQSGSLDEETAEVLRAAELLSEETGIPVPVLARAICFLVTAEQLQLEQEPPGDASHD